MTYLAPLSALLNLQITSVSDMYKLLQEYNSSLQLYNSKLQTDLDASHETVKHGEKEKAAIAENLSTLRGQYMALEDQYTSCKVRFCFSSSFLLVEMLSHFPWCFLVNHMVQQGVAAIKNMKESVFTILVRVVTCKKKNQCGRRTVL